MCHSGLGTHAFERYHGKQCIATTKTSKHETDYNFCEEYVFENIYMQKGDMAIGSPLSPILCNIFMAKHEKRSNGNWLPITRPWLQYVDDKLILSSNEKKTCE